MKGSPFVLGSLVVTCVLAWSSPVYAELASHSSIEWFIVNSHWVIIGKVIKAEKLDGHDVVTIENGKKTVYKF